MRELMSGRLGQSLLRVVCVQKNACTHCLIISKETRNFPIERPDIDTNAQLQI